MKAHPRHRWLAMLRPPGSPGLAGSWSAGDSDSRPDPAQEVSRAPAGLPLDSPRRNLRSAAAVYARVHEKIAILQNWERQTANGTTVIADGTPNIP